MQKFDTTTEARKHGYKITLTDAIETLNSWGVDRKDKDGYIGHSKTWMDSYTLRKAADTGECKACLVGSHYLFSEQDLKSYRQRSCDREDTDDTSKMETYKAKAIAFAVDARKKADKLPPEFKRVGDDYAESAKNISFLYTKINGVAQVLGEVEVGDYVSSVMIDEIYSAAKRGQVPSEYGQIYSDEEHKQKNKKYLERTKEASEAAHKLEDGAYQEYKELEEKVDYLLSHRREYEEMKRRQAEASKPKESVPDSIPSKNNSLVSLLKSLKSR